MVVDALPLAREKQQDLGWDDSGLAAALPVSGYPAFLREALSNLVHNAIRYTPPGGRITVRAIKDSDAALVCVDDTGPGMNAVERAHAFERFRRAHEGGTQPGGHKDARYAAEGSGWGWPSHAPMPPAAAGGSSWPTASRTAVAAWGFPPGSGYR